MTRLRLSTDHRRLPIVSVALAFMLATLVIASVVSAHVVQVTTAIDIADIKSPHDLVVAIKN